MCGVAYRNVQLIRGAHPELWIAELPPELMADSHYFDRSGRRWSVLHGMNDPRRQEKQHQHDEDGHHRPRKLDLIAAENLRRLMAVVSRAPAIFHDRVDQQAEHHRKNESRDFENENPQPENEARGCLPRMHARTTRPAST